MDEERRLCTFCEGLTMTEAAVGARGEGWRGHVVCISGEDDYQALPMEPGVLTHCRASLLVEQRAFLL